MIKINLALRKQAGEADPGKGGAVGSLGKVNLDAFKGFPIRKVVIPLIVGSVASYLLDNYKEEEIHKLDLIVTKLNNEGAKYMADAAKFKDFEPVKKQLDQDEALIRTKLDVIKRVTSGRAPQSKFLIAISSAIPSEVWLNDFRVEKTDVTFKGMALGYGQISDFMKTLNSDAFFSGIELKNSQQEKLGAVEVASFELKGKRR